MRHRDIGLEVTRRVRERYRHNDDAPTTTAVASTIWDLTYRRGAGTART